MYFDENVSFFHCDFNEQSDALKFLADEMLRKELVFENYYQGIIEREIIFPTGLFVNQIGIAIPHTDGDKVKRAQIGFMSLTNPIKFKEMGNLDSEIEVSIIFMLALKEPHQQMEMLQKLIELFQNEAMMKQIIECDNAEEFIHVIHAAGLA